MLRGWQPATVIDLRGAEEHQDAGHPLAGATYHRAHAAPTRHLSHPGHPGRRRGIDDGRGPWWPRPAWYRLVGHPRFGRRGFLEQSADKIVRILDIVAHHRAPILIHCTAGKDRTGVVAVLLRAAGVSRAAITTDYRATEPALPAILARSAHLTAGLDVAGAVSE
jgi:hypothetical protein